MNRLTKARGCDVKSGLVWRVGRECGLWRGTEEDDEEEETVRREERTERKTHEEESVDRKIG